MEEPVSSPIESITREDILPEDFFDLPLERSIAIDEAGACEIDDSLITKQFNQETGCYEELAHIPNGGVLRNHPELLEDAEARQRSDYKQVPKETMLPHYIARRVLSLDADQSNGVPAFTFKQSIDPQGSRSRLEVYRSRVIATSMTPEQFARRFNLNRQYPGRHKSVTRIVKTAALTSGKPLPDKLTSGMAKRIVEAKMMHISQLTPYFFTRLGIPVVNRVLEYEDPDDVSPNATRWGQYTLNPHGHEGTNGEQHCHITSPLRRWPDLLMHQLLDAHLQGLPQPYSDTEIEEKVRRMNDFILEHRARLAIRTTAIA